MKVRVNIINFILVIGIVLMPGCWNYSDIDEKLIVSGFTIDKNYDNNKYQIYFEVLDFEMSGKEFKQVSRLIESEGVTVFDAVRNAINITGKKLYFAHTNIIIISQDIAKEGIIPALDFIYRDAEASEQVDAIISREKTAKEILEQQPLHGSLKSLSIYTSIDTQTNLAKALRVRVYELVNLLESDGISVTLPSVGVRVNDGKKVPELNGSAVFKSDKLIGFLNSDETKYLMFVLNNVNRGLMIVTPDSQNQPAQITLDIFKVKTKVLPVYSNGKLIINIEIKPTVNIAEIGTSIDYIEENNRLNLKKTTDESLKASIQSLIKKAQIEYNSDIFGFGKLVKANIPNLWKTIGNDWDTVFSNLEININVDTTFINSALTSKSIRKR